MKIPSDISIEDFEELIPTLKKPIQYYKKCFEWNRYDLFNNLLENQYSKRIDYYNMIQYIKMKHTDYKCFCEIILHFIQTHHPTIYPNIISILYIGNIAYQRILPEVDNLLLSLNDNMIKEMMKNIDYRRCILYFIFNWNTFNYTILYFIELFNQLQLPIEDIYYILVIVKKKNLSSSLMKYFSNMNLELLYPFKLFNNYEFIFYNSNFELVNESYFFMNSYKKYTSLMFPLSDFINNSPEIIELENDYINNLIY